MHTSNVMQTFDKPPPFKACNTRIPIMIPIKGMGFINLGSTLGLKSLPAISMIDHGRRDGRSFCHRDSIL